MTNLHTPRDVHTSPGRDCCCQPYVVQTPDDGMMIVYHRDNLARALNLPPHALQWQSDEAAARMDFVWMHTPPPGQGYN